jgi:hypothetical protein
VGGPLVDVPGLATIPFPAVAVEGRHGIAHHFDINYGLQLFPILYGVTGGQVGASYQFNDQPSPYAPALTVGERVYGFTNIFDGRKARHDVWGLSQTDLTASWNMWGDHLFYAGGTLYAVFNDGKVFLAPFVGAQIVPGVDWLRLQVEVRYLAPYVNTSFAVVDWVAPGNQGGLLVNAGVSFVFGGGK